MGLVELVLDVVQGLLLVVVDQFVELLEVVLGDGELLLEGLVAVGLALGCLDGFGAQDSEGLVDGGVDGVYLVLELGVEGMGL